MNRRLSLHQSPNITFLGSEIQSPLYSRHLSINYNNDLSQELQNQISDQSVIIKLTQTPKNLITSPKSQHPSTIDVTKTKLDTIHEQFIPKSSTIKKDYIFKNQISESDQKSLNRPLALEKLIKLPSIIHQTPQRKSDIVQHLLSSGKKLNQIALNRYKKPSQQKSETPVDPLADDASINNQNSPFKSRNTYFIRPKPSADQRTFEILQRYVNQDSYSQRTVVDYERLLQVSSGPSPIIKPHHQQNSRDAPSFGSRFEYRPDPHKNALLYQEFIESILGGPKTIQPSPIQSTLTIKANQSAQGDDTSRSENLQTVDIYRKTQNKLNQTNSKLESQQDPATPTYDTLDKNLRKKASDKKKGLHLTLKKHVTIYQPNNEDDPVKLPDINVTSVTTNNLNDSPLNQRKAAFLAAPIIQAAHKLDFRVLNDYSEVPSPRTLYNQSQSSPIKYGGSTPKITEQTPRILDLQITNQHQYQKQPSQEELNEADNTTAINQKTIFNRKKDLPSPQLQTSTSRKNLLRQNSIMMTPKKGLSLVRGLRSGSSSPIHFQVLEVSTPVDPYASNRKLTNSRLVKAQSNLSIFKDIKIQPQQTLPSESSYNTTENVSTNSLHRDEIQKDFSQAVNKLEQVQVQIDITNITNSPQELQTVKNQLKKEIKMPKYKTDEVRFGLFVNTGTGNDTPSKSKQQRSVIHGRPSNRNLLKDNTPKASDTLDQEQLVIQVTKVVDVTAQEPQSSRSIGRFSPRNKLIASNLLIKTGKQSGFDDRFAANNVVNEIEPWAEEDAASQNDDEDLDVAHLHSQFANDKQKVNRNSKKIQLRKDSLSALNSPTVIQAVHKSQKSVSSGDENDFALNKSMSATLQ